MRCREIYNRRELIEYISSRRHGTVILSHQDIVDTLHRWRHAIEHEPNYFTAITDDPLPFKYELVDGRLTILHEAVSINDFHRLNGLYIEGSHIGDRFMDDFETIWDRVSPELRSTTGVLKFIDTQLMPLTASRGEITITPDQRRVSITQAVAVPMTEVENRRISEAPSAAGLADESTLTNGALQTEEPN